VLPTYKCRSNQRESEHSASCGVECRKMTRQTCTGHAAPSASAQIVCPSICLLSSHNMSISSGRPLPTTDTTTRSCSVLARPNSRLWVGQSLLLPVLVQLVSFSRSIPGWTRSSAAGRVYMLDVQPSKYITLIHHGPSMGRQVDSTVPDVTSRASVLSIITSCMCCKKEGWMKQVDLENK